MYIYFYGHYLGDGIFCEFDGNITLREVVTLREVYSKFF